MLTNVWTKLVQKCYVLNCEGINVFHQGEIKVVSITMFYRDGFPYAWFLLWNNKIFNI